MIDYNMKVLINFVFFVLRLFIVYNVIVNLYQNYYEVKNPNNLIWWCCFLIFDVWIQYTFKNISDDIEE